MGLSNKICVICAADCAGKPRVKDRQGRYYCKGCHERASMPAGGAMGFGDEMVDQLQIPIEPSEPAGSPCPTCGQALASSAMLCVNCGYNRQTGQAMQTAAFATSGGGVSRGSGGAAWPLVIGGISVCWGGLMLLLTVIDVLMKLAEQVPVPAYIGNFMSALIWGTLFVGAIQLLRRNPKGPANMRVWSRIVMVLSILGLTCLGIALAFVASGPRSQILQSAGAESELEATIAIVLIGTILVAQCAWAVFLLVWFRRDAVRREIAAW